MGVGALAERPDVRGPLPGGAAQPAGDVVRGAAPARGLAVVPAVPQHDRAERTGQPGPRGGRDGARHPAHGPGPDPAGDDLPGAEPGGRADRGGGRARRGAAGLGGGGPGRRRPGGGDPRLAGRTAACARAPRLPGPAHRGAVRRAAAGRADPGHPGAQHRSAFFDSQDHLERVYPNRHETPDGFAAWAYLPLIASGRPVGTCVLAYAEPHPFPAAERAVLTSLGGLIAQALDRARLYDTKHRLAHGLQQALLPRSLAALPGIEAAARYLPATDGMEIGGDFYDLVPTRPQAAAVIGDVQGHNVTAAGLMGQIRTGVRAYTMVGQAPHEVIGSTNRLLIDLDADLFASCLYLRLDPVHGRAVMARAGHPPPLLRRPDGRVRVLDLAGGPLLGIDAAAVYPTTEVSLAPGSVLVLYTDGLVESPGVDIEDALADLGGLLAEVGDRPLEDLADEVVRHSAAARERADDVAVLLLRARDDG
ncbi:GAF domain-containing SpoIIE family protein phosphatase [Streptomyces sp. NPDC051132]|uniref:GAF domain-containing SpoIIE family protein phosphatase n=1 Tax=unclassified Streptomyces TaxID=2593676 RepID=UPI003441F7B0